MSVNSVKGFRLTDGSTAKYDYAYLENIITDTELTEEGVAADGKAVGDAIGDVENEIAELEQEITDVKSDLLTQFNGEEYLGNLIENKYIDSNDGHVVSYNGWSCTDFIEVNDYVRDNFLITTTSLSTFNVFYDSSKQYISNFKSINGTTEINVPANAKYFRLSNTSSAMANTRVENIISIHNTKLNELDSVKSALNGYVNLGDLIPDVYINNGTGAEVSYSDWSATKFIEVTDALRESFVVSSTALSTFNVFYDSSKAFISSFKINAGDTKVAIPANAKYFRLSNTTTAMQSIVVYGAIQPHANYLRGKKLVTAGDSYTAASWSWSQDYAEYDGKNFGYYIAKRNGMAFVNAGISGSTMAVPISGNHNPFVVDRYQNIPEDTDYLTLWFGINDAANCNLGTIDDEVDNTFYGAWNKVLRYYLTNRPWMRVLIIVTVGANPSFRQAIRDVAEKWGYPYLDWVQDKSIPAFFLRDGMCEEAKLLRRDAYGYNGPNEGHPNPQWYEYESTIIEARLRSI